MDKKPKEGAHGSEFQGFGCSDLLQGAMLPQPIKMRIRTQRNCARESIEILPCSIAMSSSKIPDQLALSSVCLGAAPAGKAISFLIYDHFLGLVTGAT